jgi:hypothetical protein
MTEIIPLNITTASYLPRWKLKDAINEFLSNALDDSALGTKVQAVLRIEGRQVIITNQTTRKVEPCHFLQGASYKTKHAKFGGGYGAGMKDAIGVCACNKVQVTIRSGAHMYRSEVTQDMKVVVHDETDPRGDSHTVTVVLQSDLDWPALEGAAKGLLELHRQIGPLISSPSDEGTWHMFNNNNSSSNVAVLIRGVHFCFFKDFSLPQGFVYVVKSLGQTSAPTIGRDRPFLTIDALGDLPDKALQVLLRSASSAERTSIQAYLDHKLPNRTKNVQPLAQQQCTTAKCKKLCPMGKVLCRLHDSSVAANKPQKIKKITVHDNCQQPACTNFCRKGTNRCAVCARLPPPPPPLPPSPAREASPDFLKLRDKYDEVSKVALRLIVQNPPIIVDQEHFNRWVEAKALSPATEQTIKEVRDKFVTALRAHDVPFVEVGSTVRGLALRGPEIDLDVMSELTVSDCRCVRDAMESASFCLRHEFKIPNRELWVDQFVHSSYPSHPVEISYFQLAREREAHKALVEKLLKLSGVETVRDAIVGMKRWLRAINERLESAALTKHIPLRAPSVLLECLVAAARDTYPHDAQPTAFELCLKALKDLAANGSGAGQGHVTQPMHNGTTWDVLQEAATCTLRFESNKP